MMRPTLTPARVQAIENLFLILGIVLVVVAAAGVDWRLGCAIAGVALIGMAIDARLPR